jgi:hypothetical protein
LELPSSRSAIIRSGSAVAVTWVAAKFGPNYFQRVADEGGQLTTCGRRLWTTVS